MRRFLFIFATASLTALHVTAAAAPSEPRISSIYPMGWSAGATVSVQIRGTQLEGAKSLWFRMPEVQGRVLRVEQTVSPAKKPVSILHAELTIPAGAVGKLPFRVVTPSGVSNELSLQIGTLTPVLETAEHAPVHRWPAAIAGVITEVGEVDQYPIEVQAGQTVTIEARSGFGGFDPMISILEPSGSWFDGNRLNTLASNDEPLAFPGLSTDARLVHTFTRAGRFVVQVTATAGQGSPDSVYELRLLPGRTPEPTLHPALGSNWEERQFTRNMDSQWMASLARRGAVEKAPPAPELYRAVLENSPDLPLMKLPGTIEGRIGKPGEVHRIRIRTEKPEELALEIQTPQASLPRFNPIVRVLEPNGTEVVTNLYTKRNNNGLYMMKMIQAKSVFSLRAPGEYIVEIRDITTDRGGDDFAYRVLLRPQIPHIGKIVSPVDSLTLGAGESKAVTFHLDREEEFGGIVTLAATNLPPGITVLPAMEKPEEKPALPNGGRLERYTPKTQTTSLVFMADPGAAVTDQPVLVRVIARPIVNGHLGEPIPVKEFPLLIVRRPS